MKDEFYNVLVAPLEWGSRSQNPELISDPRHDHWTDIRIDRANNIIEGLYHFAVNLEEGISSRFADKPSEMTEENKATQKECRQLVMILGTFLKKELAEDEKNIHYTSTNRMEAEL